MDIILSLLVSFGLTIIIEGIVVFLFGFRKKRYYELFFFINLLTNPCVVYLSLIGDRYVPKFGLMHQIIMEIAVVIVEGFIYYVFSKREDYHIKHPFVLSLVANTISYASGFIIANVVSYF